MPERARHPETAPHRGRLVRLVVLVLASLLPAFGCSGGDSPGGSEGSGDPVEASGLEMSDSEALLAYARTRGISVEERMQALEQLVADYPDAPECEEALGFLADSFANQMRVEEAAQRYRELVEKFPGGGGNHRAHRYLLGYARKVLEDEAQARACLRAAVEDLSLGLEKDSDRLLGPTAIELANAQLELEEWEGALATYRRMVDAPASDDVEREVFRITAQFHEGNVLARLDRVGEARTAYTAALRRVETTEGLDRVRRDEMHLRIRTALEALDTK